MSRGVVNLKNGDETSKNTFSACTLSWGTAKMQVPLRVDRQAVMGRKQIDSGDTCLTVPHAVACSGALDQRRAMRRKQCTTARGDVSCAGMNHARDQSCLSYVSPTKVTSYPDVTGTACTRPNLDDFQFHNARRTLWLTRE